MSYPFKAFGIAVVSVLALAAGITPSTAAPTDADGDSFTTVEFLTTVAYPSIRESFQKGIGPGQSLYDQGQEANAVQVAPIVGRWQQTHTCDQLVDAFNAQGLGALATGEAGEYFPDLTYDELAAKDDLCSGAKPQLHYHFFTEAGFFGSLDQHENQVDEGTYTVVDSNTFRIGDATWDYSVQGGTLELTPIITDKQRRQALQHPDDFTTAAWMVSVAYEGTKWKQVPCEGWC